MRKKKTGIKVSRTNVPGVPQNASGALVKPTKPVKPKKKWRSALKVIAIIILAMTLINIAIESSPWTGAVFLVGWLGIELPRESKNRHGNGLTTNTNTVAGEPALRMTPVINLTSGWTITMVIAVSRITIMK